MPFWVCPCVPPAPALAPNRGPHMAPWRGPCRPPTWGDGLGETYAGGLTPCVTEPRRPARGRKGGEKGAINRPTLAGRLGSGWGASCRPLADESAVVTVSPDGSRSACLFGAYRVGHADLAVGGVSHRVSGPPRGPGNVPANGRLRAFWVPFGP